MEEVALTLGHKISHTERALSVLSSVEIGTIDEFGAIATSLVSDPSAQDLDLLGYIIHRRTTSLADPNILLECKVAKKPLIIEDVRKGKSKSDKRINSQNRISVRKAAIRKFEKKVIQDPTLARTAFESITLFADDMKCEIKRKDLDSIDFNDAFFQHIFSKFRDHLEALVTQG